MPDYPFSWSDTLAAVARASDAIEIEVDPAVIAKAGRDLRRVDPESDLLDLLDAKLRRCSLVRDLLGEAVATAA